MSTRLDTVRRRAETAHFGMLTRLTPSAPTAVLGAVVLGYGIWLLVVGGRGWFWGDDWEFLLRRGSVTGVDHGLFEPHNGHWSTAPIVIVRVLYALFGMTTYTPYVLVTIAIHLGIAWVMFVLLCRSKCPPWIACAAAVFVVFIPVGQDNIVWDAAMNNTGAILCGLLAVLALQGGDLDRGRPFLTWTWLVLGLMFSATGISAVVLASVFAAVVRSPRNALRVLSVPAAVFVVWFLTFGEAGGEGGSKLDVPQFVWSGLTNSFGTALGVPEAGPVVFLGLLLASVVNHDTPAMVRHLGWAGLSAATAQLFLEGLARGILGIEVAASGRYAYFTLVFLTPALAAALDRLWRMSIEPRWAAVVGAVVLAVAYAAHGIGEMRAWSGGYADITAEWRSVVIGTAANARAGEPPIATEDDPVNRYLDPTLLALPEVISRLPDDKASDDDRLRAANKYNVAVDDQSLGMFRPVFLDLTSGWGDTEVLRGPGCRTHTATAPDPLLQIATQEGTEIGISGPATQVVTVLQRGDTELQGRIWQVEPGKLYIASNAKDAVLKVSFNQPGDYTICKQ